MKIGYLTCGRDDFGYGLALVLDDLKSAGHELYRITPRTAPLVDWAVFSAFWWEHIYVIADFLRTAGCEKRKTRRPKTVVGGFNTMNPYAFSGLVDFVSVGDGENVLPELIGGNLPACVLYDGGPPPTPGFAPELRPFVHETNDIARIEVARGCKFTCTFCAVTYWKPYRELPLEGIISALRSTRRKRVALFAPEPTIHSQDEEITKAAHRLGKVRVDSDVRLDRLSRRKDSVPRVGIEGLSERLRRLVKKPYRNEQIIEAVRRAIAEGRRGMFWYVILDLPGEDEEDWREFKELLQKVSELPGAEDFVLKPSPNVFLPTPHTPMQYEPIHWDRDYRVKWQELFGRGDDRDWGVIMAERTRVFSPGMRLLAMVSTRAGEEFAEIERNLMRDKAIAIRGGRPVVVDLKRLLSVLRKFGGAEKYCGRIKPGSAPWDKIVRPIAHPKLEHLFNTAPAAA